MVLLPLYFNREHRRGKHPLAESQTTVQRLTLLAGTPQSTPAQQFESVLEDSPFYVFDPNREVTAPHKAAITQLVEIFFPTTEVITGGSSIFALR